MFSPLNKKSSLVLLIHFLVCTSVLSQPLKILVCSKTNGFRHKSIPAAKEALRKLAQQNNWEITYTEDSLVFNDYQTLHQFNVVVFALCTGKIFDTTQEKAFKAYIENGGGFVSLHTGTDCEKNWDWYMKMVGGKFKGHPKQQNAKLLKVNNQHPATKELPNEWTGFDEYYNFAEAIPPNIIPLIEVDEKSYTGGTMGKHPIAWYQYYEGGRIFQSALGHTDAFYSDEKTHSYLIGAIRWAAKAEEITLSDKFTPLLDDSLGQFDKYLGVPDPSNSFNLPKDTAGKYTQALGLNNDPLNVYSTKKEGKETLLHISGEMFGGLITKQEYGNYHFKAQFRWGDKKYAPRLTQPRNNGILYHCTGPNGVFWKVWKQSLECQVQEGDCGDLFLLSGTSAQVHTKKETDPTNPKKFIYTFNPSDSIRNFGSRVCRRKNAEKPNGKWNTIEIITHGDTSIHIVNGHINMVLTNAKQHRLCGNEPLQSGKITIQSEVAEIDYKDMEIKNLKEIPRKILKKAFL